MANRLEHGREKLVASHYGRRLEVDLIIRVLMAKTGHFEDPRHEHVSYLPQAGPDQLIVGHILVLQLLYVVEYFDNLRHPLGGGGPKVLIRMQETLQLDVLHIVLYAVCTF